jgi:putative transposase
MRNEFHLKQTIEYIHQNPVVAGLVRRPEDWKWGSAGLLGLPIS